MNPAPGESSPRDHVHAIIRKAKTSFYWGMRILPPDRREAMFAIYAFCREVDDIADDEAPTEEKLGRLAAWRGEINRLYNGAPQTQTGLALLPAIRNFGLEKKDFLAVIDGMEMDARGPMRAPSLAEFELYCARVAGAVGLLSTRAFGEPSKRARDHAIALGHALQTTNILRDVCEDAGRGRLYLPRELLEAHGILETDPAAVLAHPSLPAVCADLARRARRHFQDAEDTLRDCNRSALRPASIMRAMYKKILARLEERGWHDLSRPVRIHPLEKLWIVLRYGVFNP